MPLEVYRSSAGTGKTTTLVSEYLRIALLNPPLFRKILAITFTNKAANEMKDRVVQVLGVLAQNPDIVRDEYGDLISSLNLDTINLKQRATLLLSLILHNYDEFAISTIDSFIHKIIRTFANDVNLPQNFEVVIDINDFVPDVISLLYDKVGSDTNLTKLLVDFVISNTDEESSYDPTRKLASFINYQMREDSFKYARLLQNLEIEKLGNIVSVVRSYMVKSKESVTVSAVSALSLIEENKLSDSDFFNGSRGIISFFRKAVDFKVDVGKLFPGSYAEKTISENKWNSPKASIAAIVAIENIASQLTEYYNDIIEGLKQYLYFSMVFNKIYSVALVNEIRKVFDDYTLTTGKVHISEFNKKISEEIAGQPVPYIFERLGNKYRYFLIDEFQDTSVLQWNNLLPLIEESLSKGDYNMLVGDAKQAIYRFRSGEVELFVRLPELYGITDDFFKDSRQQLIESQFKETVLSVNWRSNKEIIDFNNRFFEAVVSSKSEYIQNIYKNHKQDVPPQKADSGGFVSLNIIDAETPDDYILEKNIRIFNIIDELKNKNFQLKDICILCRSKAGAIDISAYLLENGIDVVSSESLLLINSGKVMLIIAVARLMRFPADPLAAAEFVRCYTELNNDLNFDNEYERFPGFMKSGISGIFNYLGIDDMSGFMVSGSVYELSEYVIRYIILDADNDPFLQNFLDYVFENNDTIDKFLEKWERKKGQLFISMPDDMNAAKVMTIHKAKGLKFPVVIVETSGMIKRNTITEYWESAEIAGAEELKATMMPMKSELELIGRGDIYNREVEKSELDNLNLVYVAFTRPVEALFTVSKTGKRSGHILSGFIDDFLNKNSIQKSENGIYNFGELSIHPAKDIKKEQNRIVTDKMFSCQWVDYIKIAESRTSGLETIDLIAKNEYGNIIHELMSRIVNARDVEKIMATVYNSGLFKQSECSLINEVLLSVVNHPDLSYLYGDDVIVRNEAEIILNNGEVVRPDRLVFFEEKIVIVDYKTGSIDESHKKQMLDYTVAVNQIYNTSVVSLLVYIGDELKVVYV